MAIWCLALCKKRKDSVTEGYYLCDTNKVTEQIDKSVNPPKTFKQVGRVAVPLENLKARMKAGMKIENLVLDGEQIKFSSGTEDSYPVLNIKNGALLGMGKLTPADMTIQGQIRFPFVVIEKHSDVNGVTCVLTSGRLVTVSESAIIDDVELRGRILCNATIVNDNGKKYIRSKRGELEQTNMLSNSKNESGSLNNSKAPNPYASLYCKKTAVNMNNVNKAAADKVATISTSSNADKKMTKGNVEPTVVMPSKPIRSEDVPSVNQNDIFEFDEDKEIGTFIKRVKVEDEEKFKAVFGENGCFRFPVIYNGKEVRCIDTKAFNTGEADSDELNQYVNDLMNPDKLGMLLCNIKLDSRGATGFKVVDAYETWLKRLVGDKASISLNISGNNRLIMYIVPHICRDMSAVRVVDTIRNGVNNYIGNVIIKFGNNITEVNARCMADLPSKKLFRVGVDIRESKISFISDEFAKDSRCIAWMLMNKLINKIHSNAFYKCILNVTIPNSVEEIADNAFRECILDNIKFENGCAVKRIGRKAFYGCTLNKAENFTLSFISGRVSTEAFGNIQCKEDLDCVTIPGTIKELGDNAIYFKDRETIYLNNINKYSCNKINKLIIEPGVEKIGTILPQAYGEIIVPDNLKSIAGVSRYNMETCELKIVLSKGCDSEQYWRALKKTVEGDGCSQVELVYTNDDNEESRNSFLLMVKSMGIDKVAEMLQESRENKTPFSLDELLSR